MNIGIVEFSTEEPRLPGIVGADVAWRLTSRGFKAALADAPVDAIAFHVQLEERDDLTESLHLAESLRPEVKLLMAASTANVLIVSEIVSISVHQGLRSGREAALSAREVQVLMAIRAGRTNREIAGLLGISLSTVNRHVENILQKLSARNRAQAAAETLGLNDGRPRLRQSSVV